MINIDQINQDGHLYFPQYRYRFPSIDFKFQNTGDTAAYLWQFKISILSVEVDPTPVFDFHDFKVDVEDNALQITATNNGWGTAYDCCFKLNEPTLNLLFSDSDRQYKATINSGENRNIFHLSYEHIDPNNIKLIKKEFRDIIYFPLNPKTQLPSQETIYGIELRNLKCQWRCRDGRGFIYENEAQIWDWLSDFVLTKDGFCKIRSPKSGAGFPSEVTYSTIIDPTKGPYEQAYPISRKIAARDIERFHILIGSPISCHLLVKFKFLVDKTQVVESEVFDVKVWNPRGSAWHYVYKDGLELHRDIEKQQTQASNRSLGTWEIEQLKRLEQKALDYPFFTEET